MMSYDGVAESDVSVVKVSTDEIRGCENKDITSNYFRIFVWCCQ